MPPFVCSKRKSKKFIDCSENVVFEKINTNKCGLKQNILLDKNMLLDLEMNASILCLDK